MTPLLIRWTSSNRYKYQSLVDFSGFRIYPNNRDDLEYNEICSKVIGISVKRFMIKFLMIFVSGVAAISGPIYVYITTGIKTSTTELRIPFTDENSNDEFISNIFLQLVVFFIGTCGYLGMEVLMTIFENVVTISPKIVEFELEKLHIKQKSMESTEQQVHVHFKNIVKQCIDTQK